MQEITFTPLDIQWFRNHQYLHDGKYALHPQIRSCAHTHRFIRYADLNSFLREDWEAGFLNGWDANDLLTLLNTWYTGDVSLVRDGGDYAKCLSNIKAKGLIMPCKTDLYFPVSIRLPNIAVLFCYILMY